jgi:hypothetical protein
MATITSVDEHAEAGSGSQVQMRHLPLSRIVVLSRGSAASVRMVAPSG